MFKISDHTQCMMIAGPTQKVWSAKMAVEPLQRELEAALIDSLSESGFEFKDEGKR